MPSSPPRLSRRRRGRPPAFVALACVVIVAVLLSGRLVPTIGSERLLPRTTTRTDQAQSNANASETRVAPAEELGYWRTISTIDSPDGRAGHTAVWTGAEMIVWGGYAHGKELGTGGRYNPATNTWTPLPREGAPSERSGHVAVWTGAEMIVWGGGRGAGPSRVLLANGARYIPTTDRWAPLPSGSAVPARDGATAVWTGQDVVIWGGTSNTASAAGATYSPSRNTWRLILVSILPTRSGHTAVWTGRDMLIWGGSAGSTAEPRLLAEGARYTAASQTWRILPPSTIPERTGHSAVWTGAEMIVWGGRATVPTDGAALVDGARYTPTAENWQTLPDSRLPAARHGHTSIWTGSEMIVWGGSGVNGKPLGDGARYRPIANAWAPMASTSAPSARIGHTAIWTGSQMIVWGGESNGANLNDGGQYTPP